MVRKDGSDAHRSCVQRSFPTKTTQGRVTMYDVDLFSYYDVPEDGEEREDSWHGCRAIYGPEGHIVALEAICKVSYSCSVIVGVGYDHHFVTSIDEPLRKLIYVALDASWLGEEEVADHSDIIRCFRHGARFCIARSAVDHRLEMFVRMSYVTVHGICCVEDGQMRLKIEHRA